MNLQTKNAIVIGASSGIGKAIAFELDSRGYTLGLTARRLHLLEELKTECKHQVFISRMDVKDYEESRRKLSELIREMGSVDLFIFNAGVGGKQNHVWENELAMHQINAVGFANLASYVFNYMKDRTQPGHIAGVSSIVGIRGMRYDNGYGATKAFMSNYMEGLQHKAIKFKLPVHVTDIRPGFIDTEMLKGLERTFWVRPLDKSARQIVSAIEK